MNKLKQLWINLRASVWFTPTLTVVLSIVLATGLIQTTRFEAVPPAMLPS